MLFTIIIFIEAACFLFALFYLRTQKGWWKNFIWFLGLSVLFETGGYFLYFVYHIQNHWLFNIFLPIEISFLCYVLYHICRNYFKIQWYLLVVLAGFFIMYLIESVQSKWTEYSGIANSFASVVIVLLCCLFYYFLLKGERYIHLNTYPQFWIISGLFVFYLGSIGVGLFVNQLAAIYIKSKIPIRYIIMLVLNFILYACWSYAFLCRYRQNISSSS